MADDNGIQSAEEKGGEEEPVVEELQDKPEKESSDEEESDYDSDNSSEDGAGYYYSSSEGEQDNTEEVNIRKLTEAIDSRSNRKREEEEERNYVYHEDRYEFPKDPEKWREEDLRELWADGPIEATKPGWDPVWADEEDWEIVREEVKAGRDPPIAPFYLPYRKYYPAIPDNHFDISNPKSVIEELDRIEEFLKWVSYIFPDGSTYEGTVWDDYAHGKGVYVAEEGLVRYEGEWLQNDMEGHGVVEVELPGVEPAPGSKLEDKMRAEGRIISRDFKSPEDKKWLEMDIEDSYRLAGNEREIPFYERDEWITVFGQKPEKGRYRYAGQWKHGRMHGCGVYEVNERIIYGRFYFGEYVEDSTGCDDDVSAVHAGIAEVAAAKARMFVNKPDGMVREERGPYGDPQHPYFYEEDDVWMAPGFVNQFYDIPDYWKTYAQEVDQEREMWLNSFYKAPLRIPMPAELEYWWSKRDHEPEFVLINKEPEPDPEDPSKLIYKEDPLIVHTPTGRLIDYVDDPEYGVRLFWRPELENGEDVDPEKAVFLPLGFDEFYGRTAPEAQKESKLSRLIAGVENTVKPMLEKLERWTEEKKKASEMNRNLIEKELEFIEAEISLEEAMDDMETVLKMKQKEEEKRAASEEDIDQLSGEGGEDGAESEGEDDEEDEGEAPTSFGTVRPGEADKKEDKSGKSPFSSLSLSFPSSSFASLVTSKLPQSFLGWKRCFLQPLTAELSHQSMEKSSGHQERLNSVKFRCSSDQRTNMRAVVQKLRHGTCKRNNGHFQLNSLARILSPQRTCKSSKMRSTGETSAGGVHQDLNILSLHVPVSDSFTLS